MTRTDRRPHLYRAYDHAADITAGVDDSQLPLPTPCRLFDVGDLMDHLAGAAARAAALGRGEEPGTGAFPHVGLADAPGALRRARADAESAWSPDARLEAVITMPWGKTYDGWAIVDMYLVELATHAWDLAAATGQLRRLDPSLAPVALEAAHSMLEPENRNALEEGSPFGSEMPAPEGATDWERLAAFMGRSPRPAGAPAGAPA